MTDLLNQLFNPTTCSCHIIDSSKFQILLWKRIKADQTSYYLLKIADQRFISQIRTDKKGETYWKFKEFSEDKSNSSESISEELSATEKFQARQAITQSKENDVNTNQSNENINRS